MRYMLFVGEFNYPAGGMSDYQGHFDTMRDVVKNLGGYDWFNVYDTKTGKIYDHDVTHAVINKPFEEIMKWAADIDGPLMHDFGDTFGAVEAHQHPNGGGWVADTATVADTAYVGPKAKVFGYAKVCDNAYITGNAKIYDNACVFGTVWVRGDDT